MKKLMELPPIQREILTALINLARQKGIARGEEIAGIIDRNPGTIRNQMQALKALGLVEGVPGPKGGYKPTREAYEVLSIEEMEVEATVPIYKDGALVEGATVAEINFTTVRHPYLCYAAIKVLGNIRDFNVGDKVQLGPTPVNKLMIKGEVRGRDDTDNVILCSISEMISLPKKPIKEYIPDKMIFLTPDTTIQEAACTLVKHGIHGAPVKDRGKIVGIVTFTDVGRAIAEKKLESLVRDIMTKDIITIDAGQMLNDAIKVLNEHKIGRLVVTEKGKPIGIITKTDVLSELAVY